MKRLLFVCFLAAMSGCDELENPKRHRETISVGGFKVRVFEYDGHFYLTRYRGGIIHSESCPCKKKEVK